MCSAFFSFRFAPYFFPLFMQEWHLDKSLHYISYLLLEQLARLFPLGDKAVVMSQVLLCKESTHALAFLYAVEMKEMGKFPCISTQFCYKKNAVPKRKCVFAPSPLLVISQWLSPMSCMTLLDPASALTFAFALVLGQLDVNSLVAFLVDLVFWHWLQFFQLFPHETYFFFFIQPK